MLGYKNNYLLLHIKCRVTTSHERENKASLTTFQQVTKLDDHLFPYLLQLERYQLSMAISGETFYYSNKRLFHCPALLFPSLG